MQPCLTNKTLTDERITLTENGKDVSDKRELVKTSIEYFSNIVSNVDIQCPLNITLHHDSVLNALKKS